MKKVLTLLLLAVSICASAANLKTVNGNASVLKTQGSATFECNFSSTTWEKKEDFKTWCGKDYDERVKIMTNAFIDSFNKNSKGLKIATSDTNAAYKIVFDVVNMERHQAGFGTWGQGTFFATGTLKVVEVQTGNVVCEIAVSKFGAGADYTYSDGMRKCYNGLGKAVAKLKK